MKKVLSLIILLAFITGINLYSQDAKAKPADKPAKKEMPQSKNAPKFDAARDSEKDLAEAIVKAKASGKYILLDVGGEWCIWCKTLDLFFYDNEELHNMLVNDFEIVKVNWDREHPNAKFLSKFPKITGYPTFFILDKNGRFIQTQDTGALESGVKNTVSYNIDKLKAFLTIWAPNK